VRLLKETDLFEPRDVQKELEQSAIHQCVRASHAYSIIRYLNVKFILLNWNANIYFNKICLELKLIPRYAHINVNNSSAAKRITEQAQKFWVKNEL
jgi:hypothetical protein